jgi:hypothetical protein
VTAWSPGEGFFPNAERVSLRFRFSTAPDRLRVQKAFTLNRNGERVEGAFIWEGDELRFEPYGGFEKNAEYEAAIGQEACDTAGVSLDAAFRRKFYTRLDGNPPAILAISPEDGGDLLDARRTLHIVFAEPFSILACAKYITISPSIEGRWDAVPGLNIAKFVPAVPWTPGERYVLKIGSDFASPLGIPLGREIVSVFSLKWDVTPPILKAVYAINENDEKITELQKCQFPNSKYIFTYWETNYRLMLEFSKEIEGRNLERYLSIDGAGRTALSCEPGLRSVHIVSLDPTPEWDAGLIVTVGKGLPDSLGIASEEEYTYRIRVNGPRSRPPRLAGAALVTVDGERQVFAADGVFGDLVLDSGQFPPDVAKSASVELYFDLAEGAGLNLFSIMENFCFEATNSALYFSPRAVCASGFSLEEPAEGFDGCTRIEVKGALTNYPRSGLVSLGVKGGLADTHGNRQEGDSLVYLVK